MELAIRIRRARTRKQYSQLELASLLNVGRSAVANWECGAKIPSSLRLQHIAMVTDVSFEWLHRPGISRIGRSVDAGGRRNDGG